jgi:hypothetical protein
VLDELAASSDIEAPVPVEFYGRARDMRRCIAIEDGQYDATVDVLIEPVRDRLARYPQRSLRQEMLIDLVQGWRFMACRDWRLSLDARLAKSRASLTEHRLVAGVMRRRGDPNWHGIEEDLAIIRADLKINRGSAHLESRCVATLSLHAIARRLQRHPDGSIEAVLFDVNLIAQAAGGALVAGAGYRMRTDEQGGGWRGRVIRQRLESGSEQNVLAVRTWLDA